MAGKYSDKWSRRRSLRIHHQGLTDIHTQFFFSYNLPAGTIMVPAINTTEVANWATISPLRNQYR
jgi:hypothetical protein